ELIRHRNYAAPFVAPLMRMRTRKKLLASDPMNNFDWIMSVSEKHGLTSAFYFICGRTDTERDAQYEIEHPAIRQLLRSIHKRGHEIGLHPSFNTFLKPQLIMEEGHRLRTVCKQEGIHQDEWGGRMHYLRWRHPI